MRRTLLSIFVPAGVAWLFTLALAWWWRGDGSYSSPGIIGMSALTLLTYIAGVSVIHRDGLILIPFSWLIMIPVLIGGGIGHFFIVWAKRIS